MLSGGLRVGPYTVLDAIGAGGMGEVWRARDDRLQRDVALKALPIRLAAAADRLRRLEEEARILASLNHPGIATLYGLEQAGDGSPVLVMELVEGVSLEQRLRPGPLSVGEALSVAQQVAAALAAAHDKGVLHRDVKPANVQVGGDGRVKLLDFGIAKALGDRRSGPGQPTVTHDGEVAGTPSYMSPEQVRGHTVDRRADVWAFGCVLYEMLAGRKAFPEPTLPQAGPTLVAAEPDWEALPEATPPAVRRLLERCLRPDPVRRLRDLGDARLELEEVAGTAVRPARPAADLGPYPGLRPFTEDDAEEFFGREVEVEALWSRIRTRSLLAVIGPSGAGKSSFLRAGVMPRRPSGWTAVLSAPGSSPFLALSGALIEELAGDASAVAQLLRFEDPDTAVAVCARWRRGRHALLVLDQFEELFTLNPPDVQARFAALLGRIASEAGVHVLLSMRDDFLMRCEAHPALHPVFSELTPLGVPAPPALRRALVEPAALRGYGFEDEGLIEEMIASVGGERGALPLLAFAAARLWDERDPGRRLLTRDAYVRIGGVSGALARHAEAVLDRIGRPRGEMVREIFRNLVTAQGTRAARAPEDLLSVFGSRGDEARAVLDQLVAARLLNAYEAPRGDAAHPTRQVEIAHESLLEAWPRVARWRAQDAEGALLREQLRTAARIWEDRGRPADLLWTGHTYREFVAWRERYPGGLTGIEEDFARAMAAQAERHQRRQRRARAAISALLAAGALVFAGLWRRSEQARQAVTAEAQRRESAELLALGRLALADDASAALAYTLASLQRSDTAAARRFVVEALWRGVPAVHLASGEQANTVDFSPDGRWLAVGSAMGARLFSHDGGAARPVHGLESGPPEVRFLPHGRGLLTRDGSGVRTWPLGGGPPVRLIQDPLTGPWCTVNGRAVALDVTPSGPETVLRSWPVEGGPFTVLDRWPARPVDFDVDETCAWMVSAHQAAGWKGTVTVRRLGRSVGETALVLEHRAESVQFRRPASGLITQDLSGVHVWSLSPDKREAGYVRTLKVKGGRPHMAQDPDGRFLVTVEQHDQGALKLWNLEDPLDAEPVVLRRAGSVLSFAFHPEGSWLAVALGDSAVLYSLRSERSRVLRGYEPSRSNQVEFSPDGRFLASGSDSGALRLWPLDRAVGSESRVLHRSPVPLGDIPIRLAAYGRFVLVANRFAGRALTVPVSGEPPRSVRIPGLITAMELSADGVQATLAGFEPGKPGGDGVYLHDVGTGRLRKLPRPPASDSCAPGTAWEAGVFAMARVGSRLLTDGYSGLRLWDLRDQTSVLLRKCSPGVGEPNGAWFALAATPDGRRAVIGTRATAQASPVLTVFDIQARSSRAVDTHGGAVSALTLDPTGAMLVTGDHHGLVRVGPLTGGEPHILYGHTEGVTSVAVSRDGRWVASASQDGTIRIWPFPRGQPLHDLPHERLLAKLEALTNLRVVADPRQATGYRVDAPAFPGWAPLPEW